MLGTAQEVSVHVFAGANEHRTVVGMFQFPGILADIWLSFVYS